MVIRHGSVADHQGDVALTPEGQRLAFDAGIRLSEKIGDGQTASILYAPSERTRATAEEMALGLADGLHRSARSTVRIALPCAEPAIRNFHFVIAGQQLPPTDAMHPSFPAAAEQDPYLKAFWSAKEDRIGYWMSHPSEHAESPAAVAARLNVFFQSLLDVAFPDVSMLVTHSGPMRAFLRAVFGADPGEPEFCEWFLVNMSGVHYRGGTASLLARNGSSV